MNQEAKADKGKLRLTLVPRQIIYEIAKVREFGTAKYKDPDNWKRVEIERYRDAAYRHFMKYLDEPYGVDEESGLPHLSHLATNISFLCEMQKDHNYYDKNNIVRCMFYIHEHPYILNIPYGLLDKRISAFEKKYKDKAIVITYQYPRDKCSIDYLIMFYTKDGYLI